MNITFDNTFFNITTVNEYYEIIRHSITGEKKVVFFYLNSYSYYLAQHDPLFCECFNRASYIIPDGTSIVWAVKLLNKHRIQKITFNHSYFAFNKELFVKMRQRVFLLGSTDDILCKITSQIQNTDSDLNIVGTHNGYFTDQESDEVLALIEKCKPDILLVGMGMPKSEIWIMNNIDSIAAKCIFTVGNFFEIIAEEKKLAPNFLINTGFEWFYRLLQEPRRLLKRYLKANSYFAISILKLKLKLFSGKQY